MAKRKVIPKVKKPKSTHIIVPFQKLNVNIFCRERALNLLEENTCMTLNEIDAALGFNRRTVQRALLDLTEHGYILELEDNEYEYIED